ncbi:MAG TPA: peptidoglycan DD-metalloendopeptidase family protein [Candidatus Limnocylindria bacterium]|jgi:murein DD-endopeptidase MepM/ murein hydrolase activator NlpD
MRRRSRLTATLVALVTVSGLIVGGDPRDPVLAADPIQQAKAERASIQRELADQRARLDELRARSSRLSDRLDLARAALADITAEYERVVSLLTQVRQDVREITAQLARLRARIDRMDDRLRAVSREILAQTEELRAREALLQDHLRSAYEQSQTSLLEVLLSAPSLDAATNQVGYLVTLSEQDEVLADQIRVIREQLAVKKATLQLARTTLNEARAVAVEQEQLLTQREHQLRRLVRETARLRTAAAQKRAEQEAALNAALAAKGDVAAQVERNEAAFRQATSLVHRLVAERAALIEARRLAEEEARREARRQAKQLSAAGYRWPEVGARITQEWGPTNFALEPPYTYQGTYYPHFHGGIDMTVGCGAPILAAKAGVVVASGRPLWPYDAGYGVVLDHGGGIQTWYWHITTQIIVQPGQVVGTGQVIGYEGTTGFSTGCHLHFATNVYGIWENPRFLLP